jgi:hypothetical protein
VGVGERCCGRAESLTRRRKRLLHQLQSFLPRRDSPLKLSIFRKRQHLLELRPGAISGLDQISSSHQQLRANLLLRQSLILLFGEFVVIQTAKAGERVHAVQGEMLFKLRQAEEALERGLFHLVHIAEAHVVLDERDDLCRFFE